MITDLQQTRSKITELPPVEDSRYENIFNMAKQDKYFFYNINKKISFPDDLAKEVFFEIKVSSSMPWTTLSQQVYGDQNLWWLICLVNKIFNPIDNPELGKRYRVIKPIYVGRVLAEINKQL